ncbi:hypothetical protein H4W34_000370 [Actinomadura algeriensis]|uniref:Uncharacterized protein n=1 Tax=Actinomadura algeriensis TaxID=1679523 RepID=A0ABR9JJ07_9ACTN|nr:hypothetical protein [Actinomadura algeriensis]
MQEAWPRLRRLDDPADVRDLRAWLTRTVGRLAPASLGSAPDPEAGGRESRPRRLAYGV